MNTIGSYFKQLGILHGALCAGVAIIMVIFKFMNPDKQPNESAQMFLIIGVIVAALNLILSRVMLFKIAAPAQQHPLLSKKLAMFRTGFIVQMALLEGAAIINLIMWFLGGHTFNMGAALGLLFLMVFRRPSRSIVQQLVFNTNEDGKVVYNDEVVIDNG